MKKLISTDKLMKALRDRQCTNTLIDIVEHEISYMTDDLTIPENPTNGDMIKALFPNQNSDNGDSVALLDLDGYVINTFPKKWWNAPYERGKE